MTEPRRQPNDVVTRELLDERTRRLSEIIASGKELENVRHAAIEAKLLAAKDVLEQRLHLLNNLRSETMTRVEYLAQHEALAVEFHAAVTLFQAEINGLKEWKAELRGSMAERASVKSVVGAYILAIFGMLASPLIALMIERLVMK